MSNKENDLPFGGWMPGGQVTLRDRFAMAALTGLLASGEYTMHDASEYCWAAADHALKMRTESTVHMREGTGE